MSKWCKCKMPALAGMLVNGQNFCLHCNKPIKPIKPRRTWTRNPKTQIRPNKKRYNRRKEKDDIIEQLGHA